MFELISPVGGGPLLPGPWAGRTAPPADEFAFSTSAGAQPAGEMPIWRVDLPAEVEAARAEIAAGEASVQSARLALAAAPARLTTALQRRPPGVSFSSMGEAQPEARLFSMLGALEQPPDTLSFGLGEDLRAGWQQAGEQFRSFAAQAREAIANYALVETRAGTLLIGRTSVGWSGDMRTCWPRNVAGEQADLHRRALVLALESRAALLRTFILVVRGAGLVAQAVSSPIGTVTAIPAAWRFVSEILSESRQG